jgi:WD40 repeat protein
VVRALDGAPAGLYFLSFIPGGKSVVGWGQKLHVWDAASGKQLLRRPWRAPNAPALPVALSQDGKFLATGDTGVPRAFGPLLCHVRRFDLADGKERWQSAGGQGQPVSSVAFSPDGKVVASSSDGSNDVAFWEAATGKPARPRLFLTGPPFRNPRIAYLPGGNVLAVASEYFTDKGGRAVRIALRDLAGGKELSHFDAPGGATALLAFAPDGRRAAFVAGHEVIVCALPSGKEVQRLRGDSGPVHAAAFARDGKVLATGNADGTVLIWRVVDRAK